MREVVVQNGSAKQFLLWLHPILRLRAINGTRLIAQRFGTRIGFTYVGGYPKSGTTWISQMVAHYLDIPFVNLSFLPLTFKGLVHHHWDYHPAFDHSIYVIRDGRDVMVSVYMNLMKAYTARREALRERKAFFPVWNLAGNVGQLAARDRHFQRLFGRAFDPWDVSRNLPVFMEVELQKPFIPAVKQPWPDHIRTWRERAKRTTFVKYEDMLADGLRTLSSALQQHLEREPDEQEVAYTVHRYSFRRQTGRAPGEEDRTSFARKGIQGDWRNYFSREAGQVFHHYAGDLLIELGYEPDHNWVDRLSHFHMGKITEQGVR